LKDAHAVVNFDYFDYYYASGNNIKLELEVDSKGAVRSINGVTTALDKMGKEGKEYYLAKAEISPAMMTIRGFGESRPIASNRTAKGRQKNRRVEIVIEGLTR
jgi:OOP family OmpA-OmpF porin